MARGSKVDAKLAAELIRRGLVAKPTIDYRKECHAKQASLVEALVLRRSRYLSVLAGRQSGKSHGAVIGSLLLASSLDNVAIVYVTSTDASVKKMAFGPARRLNTKHKLGGKPNLADRSIHFPATDSTIYFIGADSERTIERLRGTPNLVLCLIDECGVYDSDTLSKMIEAVTPGLRPLAGALVLMGTPSLQGAQGRWFETTQNPNFEQHRFSYLDNDRVPSFADVERLIDEELAALGYTRESAYFLREYLAQFVVELSERVYQVSESNYYDGEPPADLDTFVTGGDLGMKANDALVTLGWKKSDPRYVWVVEEKEVSGQDALAFGKMADDVNKRRRPFRMAVDAGGLGGKIIATVKSLHPGLPIVEAKKPPIAIQVKAVNLLAQPGRLKVRRNSKLAQELARPTWVDALVGGEIDEHGQHGDLGPSLRYAVLEAMQYLPRLAPVALKLTPDELALKRIEDARLKEEADMLKQWRQPHGMTSRPYNDLTDVLGPRRQRGSRGWG